jgi:hypothetical protein
MHQDVPTGEQFVVDSRSGGQFVHSKHVKAHRLDRAPSPVPQPSGTQNLRVLRDKKWPRRTNKTTVQINECRRLCRYCAGAPSALLYHHLISPLHRTIVRRTVDSLFSQEGTARVGGLTQAHWIAVRGGWRIRGKTVVSVVRPLSAARGSRVRRLVLRQCAFPRPGRCCRMQSADRQSILLLLGLRLSFLSADPGGLIAVLPPLSWPDLFAVRQHGHR